MSCPLKKNVFDNIFNIVMDMKGKTKDNLKAKKDLAFYCNCQELELKEGFNGKMIIPKAPYTLTKEQRKMVCEWVKKLRLLDGYTSNLAKCVDMQDYKLSRMKSHDCHVFMERLLPIAFKDFLPNAMWNAITEVCIFFRDICSTTLHVDQTDKLNNNIVLTLCKL